jgi:hypothetical protein
MIRGSDFRSVTVEDDPLFRAQYAKYPQVHSDNSFTNMVCWAHYAHYRFLHHGEHLVLSSTVAGKTRFRLPIGPRDPEVLARVVDLAVREGEETPLVLFGGEDRAWFRDEYPEIPLHPHRNFFEYVYRTEDLADLPGKGYLTIRHQLNRFRRNCAFRTEAINPENAVEVREFLQQWCDWKGCEGDPVLSNEEQALLCALDRFAPLGLSGLLIRVDGKILSMAIFQELNPETAVVHFEKGLPDCPGIYRAINQETAALLRGRYPFINRESDLGVPGLREAKERYHPHHMVEVCYTRKEDMERVL